MEHIPIAGLFKMAIRLFQIRPNDISVCQTRIIRGGRGWPWNHRIGVHPRQDGKLEITKLPE